MDILIVDDERSVLDSTRLALEEDDHYVETIDNGQTSLLRLREDPFDLVILDMNLGDENGLDILAEMVKRHPRIPVVMFTAEATIDSAVKAIQLGAMDYLEKPFTPDQLRGVVARSRNWKKMHDRIEELEVEVSTQSPPAIFESRDSIMEERLDVLFRAAPTAASLLILGESGTGKSLVAREIHRRSHLGEKPFVTISCPSLSKELLESELFGHVKGSFTGAVKDRWGKVHEANGGTLFLDEIGELPLDIQPKLLRLLQEREYERLGETKTRQADVRVIAATNRDLKQCVAEGTFREDLYYRLNVIAVEIPPLRERPNDLRYFAETFCRFFSDQTGRRISGFGESGLTGLVSHDWPGNVRELRNAIERAVILCSGDKLEAKDLPAPEVVASPGSSGGGNGSAPAAVPGGDVTLEQLEEEHIRRVLARTSTLQEASATLGIDQATLYRKRKKMGIE